MKMKKAIAGLCAGVVAISAMATTAVFAEDTAPAAAGTVTEIDLTRPYLEWTWGGEWELKGHMATTGYSTGSGIDDIVFNFGKIGEPSDFCIPGETWNDATASIVFGKDSIKQTYAKKNYGGYTNGMALEKNTDGDIIGIFEPDDVTFLQFGKVGEKFNTAMATSTSQYVHGTGFDDDEVASILDEVYLNYVKVAMQQKAKINTWKFYGTLNGATTGLIAKGTEVTYPDQGFMPGSKKGFSPYGAYVASGLIGIEPIETAQTVTTGTTYVTVAVPQYVMADDGATTKYADLYNEDGTAKNAFPATLFALDANNMPQPVLTAGKQDTIDEVVNVVTTATVKQINKAPLPKLIIADTNSKEEKVSYFVTTPDAIAEMNSSNDWMNAFRIMNDCIADNQGVTITLIAKDAFNELLWNVNSNMVDWKTLPGAANTVFTNNTVYASQGTGYYDPLNNWGSSLYLGGMVINNTLSRQFSDVDVFDWGTNTLTFDWDSLTEGRILDASVNVFRYGFITGTKVEWAKLQVTVPAQEAVDVAPDAAITVVEETTAAPVVTEAPVVTAAPVANPTTGNAPIALAVIPVALAAAAIVAKKSK